ncbi:MAG TPA: hypothetical protein VFZ61_29865 [Polyangiales bacterium]
MSPDVPQRLRAAALASLDLSIPAAPDASEARKVWRALILGQCRLIESFDADGHRYLIARRNPAGARASARLSEQEVRALYLRAVGTSYKVIACELNMSTAAAHGLTRSGMRKIGVHDEAELPWLFGSLSRNERCPPSP